jgi:hypothetical protein
MLTVFILMATTATGTTERVSMPKAAIGMALIARASTRTVMTTKATITKQDWIEGDEIVVVGDMVSMIQATIRRATTNGATTVRVIPSRATTVMARTARARLANIPDRRASRANHSRRNTRKQAMTSSAMTDGATTSRRD